MTPRRLRWISIAGTVALLALLVVLAVLARLDMGQKSSASVPAPLAIGTELARPRPVPRVRLIDAHGHAVSLQTWRGKWVVLAPSLTLCHEVCPMTTSALTALTQRLARAGLSGKVVVAEATVDPWRDTPSRLRAYQRLSGADVVLLTGAPTEIARLWGFFGVYYKRVPQRNPPDVDWLTGRPETFDVQHTDGVFLVDPAGQERVANVGMPDVGGRLTASLRKLLNDEGRANLAHPQLPWTADQVLQDLYSLMGKEVPAGEPPEVSPPTPAAAQRALAGSPGALTALHQQAGQLLGSQNELVSRLRGLQGYPVVLNAWASWCGPCRAEFGLFAAAGASYGRRVAFLGVDTNDGGSEARSFLAKHPVSYPSYHSSSTALGSLAVLEGLPTTIFISRAGKVVNVHAGQYQSQTALNNDIAHFALGNRG